MPGQQPHFVTSRQRPPAPKYPPARKELHFNELAATGYWFCKSCNKVTDVDLDAPRQECEHCGRSHGLKRIDPVPGADVNFRKAGA